MNYGFSLKRTASTSESEDESFDRQVANLRNMELAKEPVDSTIIVLEDSFVEAAPSTCRKPPKKSSSSSSKSAPSKKSSTKRKRSLSPVASSSGLASSRTVFEDVPDFKTAITSTPRQLVPEQLNLHQIYDQLDSDVNNERHQLERESEEWFGNFRNLICQQSAQFQQMMANRKAAVAERMEEVRGHQRRLADMMRRLEDDDRQIDGALNIYGRFPEGLPEKLLLFPGTSNDSTAQ